MKIQTKLKCPECGTEIDIADLKRIIIDKIKEKLEIILKV